MLCVQGEVFENISKIVEKLINNFILTIQHVLFIHFKLLGSYAFDRAWFLIGITLVYINNIKRKRRENKEEEKILALFR